MAGTFASSFLRLSETRCLRSGPLTKRRLLETWPWSLDAGKPAAFFSYGNEVDELLSRESAQSYVLPREGARGGFSVPTFQGDKVLPLSPAPKGSFPALGSALPGPDAF